MMVDGKWSGEPQAGLNSHHLLFSSHFGPGELGGPPLLPLWNFRCVYTCPVSWSVSKFVTFSDLSVSVNRHRVSMDHDTLKEYLRNFSDILVMRWHCIFQTCYSWRTLTEVVDRTKEEKRRKSGKILKSQAQTLLLAFTTDSLANHNVIHWLSLGEKYKERKIVQKIRFPFVCVVTSWKTYPMKHKPTLSFY